MHDSPRIRRLKSDLAALERLRSESSVFVFKHTNGSPPQHYTLGFRGDSLARERGKVVTRSYHEVEIRLGSQYPRTMPELRWLTPIYHPNISEIGMVCLGAYGTHWVPSLALDELCVMLWDMARYQNYDIRSPYNREAALWAANQTTFRFPIDPRTLRDRREQLGRVESSLVPLMDDDNPTSPTPAVPPREADEPITILDIEIDLSQYHAGRTVGRPSSSAPNAPPSSPPPPRSAVPRPPVTDEVIFID